MRCVPVDTGTEAAEYTEPGIAFQLAAAIGAPSTTTPPVAVDGVTRFKKLSRNPSAGVATTYDVRYCSYGGTTTMNGSETVSSNCEPFENCATSNGLSAVIEVGSPVRNSCVWPAFSVMLCEPTLDWITTVVVSVSARIRSVSCRRPASGAVTWLRPHDVTGGSCSIRWLQAKKSTGTKAHLWPPKTPTGAVDTTRVPVRSEPAVASSSNVSPASNLTVNGTPAACSSTATAGVIVTSVAFREATTEKREPGRPP